MAAASKVDERAAERLRIREAKPDVWIAAQEGDTITGEVVGVTRAWSDVLGRDGGYYPLLTLKDVEATGYPAPPDGPTELKVHAFSAVLFNEVMEHQPEIGEKVTFTFTGMGQPKPKQSPPALYRLQVHGRTDQAARVYGGIDGGGRPGARSGRPDPRAGDIPAGDDLPFE